MRAHAVASHVFVYSRHAKSVGFLDHALARLHDAWVHEPVLLGLGIFACALAIFFLRKL